MIIGLILVKYPREGFAAQILIFLMHISIKLKFSDAVLQIQRSITIVIHIHKFIHIA
jgi:hypothetical protein